MLKRVERGITAKQIADTAAGAVINAPFVTARRNCLRFVREVHGAVKKGSWPLPIGPNAWEAATMLDKQGYAIPLSRGSVPGDILFKAPTDAVPEGHCGIRIYGNRVAENATVHAGGEDTDARGIRSLAEFGRVAKIVRLADSKE